MGFTCWAWVVLGLMYYSAGTQLLISRAWAFGQLKIVDVQPTAVPAICIQKRQTVLFWISPKNAQQTIVEMMILDVVWTEKNLFWYAQTMIIWHHFIQPEAKPKKMKKLLYFFLMLIFREIAPYIMMIKKRPSYFDFPHKMGILEEVVKEQRPFSFTKQKARNSKREQTKGNWFFSLPLFF